MENLFQLTPMVLGAIPLVIGLVQVFKATGLPPRLAPAMSIALGLVLVAITGAGWQQAVVQGIIVGLAASGLYSGVKTTGEAVASGLQ